MSTSLQVMEWTKYLKTSKPLQEGGTSSHGDGEGVEPARPRAPTSTETSLRCSYTLLINCGSRRMGLARFPHQRLFKF